MEAQDRKMIYTFKEFQLLEGQWELINGDIYNMTPGASIAHQNVSAQLFAQLFAFLQDDTNELKKCSVYHPPTDLRFSECEDYDNPDHVVQPDIMVVCNAKQIATHSINGAPDLIVEILSPSTALKDRNAKYNLYEKFSVPEYWIVDPIHMTIEVYVLLDGKFSKLGNFGANEKIKSKQFPQMAVILK